MPSGQQVSRQHIPGGQPEPSNLLQDGKSEQKFEKKSTQSLAMSSCTKLKQMQVCVSLQKVALPQGVSGMQRGSGPHVASSWRHLPSMHRQPLRCRLHSASPFLPGPHG
jgi:hypothetical protein